MAVASDPVCCVCGQPLHVLKSEDTDTEHINHLGCTNGNFQGSPCPKQGQEQVQCRISYQTV